MNPKDREKWGQVIEKWGIFYIYICCFLGAVLGTYLIYIFQGEFYYQVLKGGLISTIILIVIEVIKRRLKKNKLPEMDERVVRNVLRFLACTSHISLFILFIALGVFTLLEKESISILYLWIFLFSYIWIAGIGVLIVKRR